MSVEVSQRARQRQQPLLTGLAGAGMLTGVVLLVWQVPPALSSISSRRYAAAVEVGTRVVLVVAAGVLVGAALDQARKRRWWWAAATLGVLVGLTTVVLLVWLAPPARYKNITPDKDHASILAGPAASTGVSRGPAVDDVLLTIRASAAGKAARARRSDPSVAK